MSEVSRGEGRTILFVSHHMAAMNALCTTGLYLNNGQIAQQGKISEVITAYTNEGKVRLQKESWQGCEGDDSVKLYHCRAYPDQDEIFRSSAGLTIEMEGEIFKPVLGLILGFTLWSEHDYELAYVLYDDKEQAIRSVAPQKFRKVFHIPANTLAGGKYRIEFDIGIQFVKRIIHDQCDIFFDVANVDGLGRKFAAQGRGRTSMFRPDWNVK